MRSIAVDKAAIVLHQRREFERVITRLSERVRRCHVTALDFKLHTVVICRDHGAALPVFNFK